MKKVLYCMHIGWDWIEQRPQFIAKELSKDFDITVISDHNYKVKDHKNQKTERMTVKKFYKIPLLDSLKFLRKINGLLRKWYYQAVIKKVDPDVIYVMTPWSYDYIKKHPKKTKIIYDCMDDMVEFSNDIDMRNILQTKEHLLIDISDFVLVSSESLIKKLTGRYEDSLKKKYSLIRNGYNGANNWIAEIATDNKFYTLCYFGTIASWFDFDLILKCLDKFNDVQFIIYGPLQAGTIVPKHNRLIYGGIIRHSELKEKALGIDCFVMPFRLTELVKSVDPVKLYEYISFGKNIITIEYEEIKRFDKYVYFYKDFDSFCLQVEIMKNRHDLKYTLDDCKKFLADNTWKQRGNDIKKIINGMF